MWIAPFICYVVTLFITLCGVQYHINIFKYPFYLGIPLTLAVFLPLSIVVLLPLDYVSHNAKGPILWFEMPKNVILVMWKSNYWSTFALTWLLLPILQEYYRSGHYNKLAKLKEAAKRNLKYQAIMLGVSLAGLVYLLLEVGLTMEHVKLMIIALLHIYSLALALWLMAHGLISIPRNRWIAGNHVKNLNHYYLQLPRLVDSLEDTKLSFKEEILQVLILEQNYTNPSVSEDLRFRDWILELSKQIPLDLRPIVEVQLRNDVSGNNRISRDRITELFMTKLSAGFNLNLSKLVAYESEFNILFTKIVELEDIVGWRSTSPDQLEQSSVPNHLYSRFRFKPRTWLPPNTHLLYVTHIKPILNRMLSVLLFISSIILIESEFLHSTKFSLMNVLVYSTGLNKFPLLQLLVTSITFSYMLFAALNSLTRVKVFNMYHLVPHKSDPVSACFYATYIARLTLPLSYNFITLFTSRSSIFEDWFGSSIVLDRAGLFNVMNNWLPRLLLIPVVLTMFNVYDKLKSKLGLNSDIYDSWALDDEDDITTDENGNSRVDKRKDLVIVEAKRMVNREWLKRKNETTREASLRPFNLAAAADLNYENNRTQFNQSLLGNRIEYRDDDTSLEPSSSQGSSIGADMWSRIGGAFTDIRENVVSRFGGNSRPSYRDVQDDFDYDNDNLVI